jgi:hypothetical protein
MRGARVKGPKILRVSTASKIRFESEDTPPLAQGFVFILFLKYAKHACSVCMQVQRMRSLSTEY